jgi:23S rRNA (pseudouridine1915-N3)-methyltransferase
MKIQFFLTWHKPGNSSSRAFKAAPAYDLFSGYIQRIGHFFACEIVGGWPKGNTGKIWVCDRGTSSRILSSAEVAGAFQRVQNTGASRLSIVIGGPDGFTKEQMESLKPDLRWSFGPMTLPHELASVVASEQIYRGLTILKGMPYHKEH